MKPLALISYFVGTVVLASEKLVVKSIEVCLCCQVSVAIDQYGEEHEVGLFNPRCPRCYRFIEPSSYKYIGQHCLNCWDEMN
jgi:hypothetical protein